MVDRQHQLLLDCYLSGQVSEAQWVEHLKDQEFAEFVTSEMGPTPQPQRRIVPCIARDKALADYMCFRDGDPEVRKAFAAGWNARKQLDYELALGIKRSA